MGDYSEALPIPTRPNNIDLNCKRTVWEWVVESDGGLSSRCN